jgi:hypothetical protein
MTEQDVVHVVDFTDSRDYLFNRVFAAMHHFAQGHRVESAGKRYAKTNMWGAWGAMGWVCTVRLEDIPEGTRLEIEISPHPRGWRMGDGTPRKALSHALRFIRGQDGLHPIEPARLFLPEELEKLAKKRR